MECSIIKQSFQLRYLCTYNTGLNVLSFFIRVKGSMSWVIYYERLAINGQHLSGMTNAFWSHAAVTLVKYYPLRMLRNMRGQRQSGASFEHALLAGCRLTDLMKKLTFSVWKMRRRRTSRRQLGHNLQYYERQTWRPPGHEKINEFWQHLLHLFLWVISLTSTYYNPRKQG